MKQTIQLKLGQNLTMTPQLQQAIRLLQLSTIELQAEIQEALDSNIMLEMADEADAAELEENESIESQAGQGEDNAEPVAEDGPLDTSAIDNIPVELAVDSDWNDIYDNTGTTSSGAPEERGLDVNMEVPESLQDHLCQQLDLMTLSDTDRVIAMAIVDAINEEGYLEAALDEIKKTLGSDMDIRINEIASVLRLVQSLDPSGVGARDLSECLLLQLCQFEENRPWLAEAKIVVHEYLPLVASRDYTQLSRRLRVSEPEIESILRLVQSLDPSPGSRISGTRTEYIVPDVYVSRQNGKWHISINQEITPKIRINSQYANLVKRADNSTDNISLRNHLQEARWFLKSLQSRADTLMKVATAIVERQTEFLENGDESMRPLVLHDIAGAVDMHESTISRVTTRKYMHTPRGIYELKYFFSSHLSMHQGGECSSTAIRALIKRLVSSENPVKPLSDSRISALLSDKGFKVARRTVAKYREAMSVPPSNERRRHA